ncbi:MAG: septation protein SpoVG family protein [Lachnospiraceae bacterium]|nr:septation protein SpoVG family protein [Lachnospiraceae bacterium]
MKVRAEMNIIDKGSLVAAGDVFLEEKIVIHQVKLIATKNKDTGNDMWVVVMPDKKKGDAWDKVVYVKDRNVYKEIESAVIQSVEHALKKDLGDYRLKVDIRLFEKGDTKAYATVTFNDAVEIHGVRLYERDGQLKVAYPYEKRDETYQNLAGPATLYVKNLMEVNITEAYEKKLKERGEEMAVPNEIPPEMLKGSPFEERSR